MTTWIDGGDYGRLRRQIMNEDGSRAICTVWTRQSGYGYGDEPWPEGKANFRLVLQAPRMLEALEKITALEPVDWYDPTDLHSIYDKCTEIARAAIAAVKGENDDLGG